MEINYAESVAMPINGYHTNEPTFVLLDRVDYERFKFWKWQESKDGYVRRNVSCRNSKGRVKWKTVLLHRAILGIENVSSEITCVDHINGNTLDNRRCNLRIVTLSENASNRHVVLNSTGILRVTEQNGRFMARIRQNGESVYLGCYDDAIQANSAVQTYQERGKRSKEIKKQREVVQINPQGKIVGRFLSCRAASLQTGVCASNISRCASGKRTSAGGFRWLYA